MFPNLASSYSEFNEQCFKEHKLLNDNRIAREWKELTLSLSSVGPTSPCFHEALLHPTKNRYPDVLPFDETRVKLSTGEYINANYIDLSQHSRFICSQAPMPNTFPEFWQMVWEHKTPVVVMLTRLYERRRIKGHCYWPSEVNETEVFGKISVTLTSTTSPHKHIQLRHFRLTNDDGKQHNVCHIHYTEWPDFGVPHSTETIRSVLTIMESYRISNTPSTDDTAKSHVIVHCSAGIGRAGTFLAIQAFVEKMKEQVPASIVIKDIVDYLRKQRMSLVQTPEQYGFIYKVVDDIVLNQTPEKSSSSLRAPSFLPVFARKSLTQSAHGLCLT